MSIIDPVNKSKVPQEWINKSNIPGDELEEGIMSGMLVVLSDGSILKRGYTTGTTATVAAKAAVLSLKKEIDHVSVPTPVGLRAHMDVKAKDGHAVAVKLNNDHESDITRGLEFVARAVESDKITITAGEGIGIVTRGGLQSKKGYPAINPRPMQQIMEAVVEAVEEIGIKGASVEISLPRGAEIAKQTLNGRIGVEGGISILGTTGFVEPWNDHLGEMKSDLIRDAAKVVLTTGRIGIRYSTMLFPDYTVVLAGSRISEFMESATGKVAICGLPGLVLKWGDPDMLKDSGFATVSEMIEVEPQGEHIRRAFEKTVEKGKGARIVVVDRDGTVLMDSGEQE
ncbi:Cobalt-precorrin-6A synthase (deacetylating) [Methanococcoides burtonii DSM 6242]|uniref:Cobalt-precorrin-5B C(1)-methyltransferase n=1 Tax=Methanococcoides burtonii (strain DSM 6242 / NBRC 107633 / OCM 468 / ACE-M) TaxID=259564 RepID=CBID_METBU|nr:RecName: Full=Cobalt-precorrin-5B C(1)-methyltransferase; AltName: Full=Cobalt-precorrin-6A synthase [Methanococcoides burtonii DSM 6242]ABE52595.1 Cobalt-precorrin-6A synthase (deacetylating) [Methanococcoides burtonii DSM 6242]